MISTENEVSFLGFTFHNNRYTNFHKLNTNFSFSEDLSQFPGPQNSFSFERAFVPIGYAVQEHTQTKWHWSIYISVVYIITIFGIQKLMKYREKGFNLRTPLIMWNFLLAAFSIFGVYRCLPEFLHIIFNEGFTASYTKSSYYLVSFQFHYLIIPFFDIFLIEILTPFLFEKY